MRQTLVRAALVAVLAASLSGCFLTKLVTVPGRVVGASISMVGAVISVVPVVGNTADAALEKVDATIDTTMDTVDEVPL